MGLRWRTQKEVVAGKGQFVCGARGCDVRDGLASFEVRRSSAAECLQREKGSGSCGCSPRKRPAQSLCPARMI